MNRPPVCRLGRILIALACVSPVNTFSEQAGQQRHGLLEPYRGEPPAVELDKKERERLARGGTVFKNLSRGDIKRGVIVFRVAAPPSVVWSVIKDFDSYPQWIDGVDSTEVYKRDNGHIYVHFQGSSFFPGKLTWYVNHDYPRGDRDWGTWVLDRDKVSDFEDSVGFWRVRAVQADPAISEVTYSADVKFKSPVPAFIERMIAKSQIKKASRWVRDQAEARADH